MTKTEFLGRLREEGFTGTDLHLGGVRVRIMEQVALFTFSGGEQESHDIGRMTGDEWDDEWNALMDDVRNDMSDEELEESRRDRSNTGNDDPSLDDEE